MVIRQTICCLVAFLIFAAPDNSRAAQKIVASIPPVHSLLSAVMEGVNKPKLLVTGNADPHGYALRPSQMRALKQADLIFRIGPDFETFLNKPLKILKLSTAVIDFASGNGRYLALSAQ